MATQVEWVAFFSQSEAMYTTVNVCRGNRDDDFVDDLINVKFVSIMDER